MTFSALISGTVPHHNKFNTRPGKVTRVIQHHWASNNSSGESALTSPSTKKSVTYLVRNDGIILGQVPEEYRPWTSGSSLADNPAITIEVQNETNGPEWKVSDAAIASIIRLLADIAKRHSFGTVTVNNYKGHRDFSATACPGPYLYPRLQSIRDAVNRGVTNNAPSITKKDSEMLLIQSTNRGIGMIGSGWYRGIPDITEVYALQKAGVPGPVGLTEKEYDIVVNSVRSGEFAANMSIVVNKAVSSIPAPVVDTATLAEAIILKLQSRPSFNTEDIRAMAVEVADQLSTRLSS